LTANCGPREHGLPHVDTALAEDPGKIKQLLSFCGYPLIVRQLAGNGSRGVRIVLDEAQRAAISRQPDHLLRAYLEPRPGL